MRVAGLLLAALARAAAAEPETPAPAAPPEPGTPLQAVLAAHRAMATVQGTFRLRRGGAAAEDGLPFARGRGAKTRDAELGGRFVLAPPERIDLVLLDAADDGWRWRLGSDGRVFWDLWLDAPDQAASPRLTAVGALGGTAAALAALPGLLRLDPARLADGSLRAWTEPDGAAPERLVVEAASPARSGFRRATVRLGGGLRPEVLSVVDAEGIELVIALVTMRVDEPLPEAAFTPPR